MKCWEADSHVFVERKRWSQTGLRYLHRNLVQDSATQSRRWSPVNWLWPFKQERVYKMDKIMLKWGKRIELYNQANLVSKKLRVLYIQLNYKSKYIFVVNLIATRWGYVVNLSQTLINKTFIYNIFLFWQNIWSCRTISTCSDGSTVTSSWLCRGQKEFERHKRYGWPIVLQT